MSPGSPGNDNPAAQSPTVMNHIFLVPKALLKGAPIGSCSATDINDTQALLVLENGFHNTPAGYDEWFTAQPGVVEYFPWDELKPAPPELVDAMGKSSVPYTQSKVATVATLRDAIRAIHPLLRWY